MIDGWGVWQWKVIERRFMIDGLEDRDKDAR